MTLTSYQKSITGDFPNARISLSGLTDEISQSAISVALERIDTFGDTVYIWFKSPLSSNEESSLDTIVSNHSGSDTTVKISTVRILEEDVETGGHFAARTVSIPANPSESVAVNMWWPFPVSCLAMAFNCDDSQKLDQLSLCVGKNTTVGVITANTVSTSTWTSQNYTAGSIVSKTDTIYGTRYYTCIVDTVSNEPTSNIAFWRNGYRLGVNSTVTANVKIGRYIRLFNGVDASECGEVVGVDATNSYIYVNVAPDIAFLASSPTYVQMSAYVLKDYDIGRAGGHEIGMTKIGGSYIPAYVLVTITYKNNGDSANLIAGRVEYLY